MMKRLARGMAMGTKRVLVVDDALIMRKRIRDIAEEAGWEVAGEAKDGEEAVALFRQKRPDLVTLDIVMPNLDGVSALKQMMHEDPQARVVMVSAVNQKEKLAECIQAGAIDFIVKPFEKASLRGFFEKYLTADNQQ
jgi:two-component system chemotaxis response regulator CheY